MIELELYIAFILASALLILVPGPNVSLIVSHSLSHGTRYGLLTVAATTLVQVLPLTLVTLGASAGLALLAEWFEWLRWMGVIYLIFLGITTWRADRDAAIIPQPEVSFGRIVFLRGMFVAITNPKTLLFYAALLSQFVDPGMPGLPQFAVLSITFLLVAFVGDSAWAMLAGRARALLVKTKSINNRISGAILICAGLGLAFARKN